MTEEPEVVLMTMENPGDTPAPLSEPTSADSNAGILRADDGVVEKTVAAAMLALVKAPEGKTTVDEEDADDGAAASAAVAAASSTEETRFQAAGVSASPSGRFVTTSSRKMCSPGPVSRSRQNA